MQMLRYVLLQSNFLPCFNQHLPPPFSLAQRQENSAKIGVIEISSQLLLLIKEKTRQGS